MKLSLVSLLLGTFTLTAAETPAITNLWLTDQAVIEIPIGLQRVTTVNFPTAIQAVDAAGLTADGRTPGVFQMAQQPAGSSLAFRALVPGASANVNVRLEERTYVLLLKETSNPVLAVNFLASPSHSFSQTRSSFTTDAAPLLTTSQLVGLLDKARAYDLLKQHHPYMVSDVTVSRPNSTNDYNTFTVILEEVFRFDASDALVFRVTLSNKTQKDVKYRRGSWAVRAGDRLYPQALGDADGIIPAGGAALAWFVIQGSPDGGRNQLSPRNSFIVLLNPL